MAYYEAGSGHLLLHLNEDNHHTYVDCNSIFQRRAKAKFLAIFCGCVPTRAINIAYVMIHCPHQEIEGPTTFSPVLFRIRHNVPDQKRSRPKYSYVLCNYNTVKRCVCGLWPMAVCGYHLFETV
eukprot:scaffold2490_cov236-Chaetoceros_neogracile.AAC.3